MSENSQVVCPDPKTRIRRYESWRDWELQNWDNSLAWHLEISCEAVKLDVYTLGAVELQTPHLTMVLEEILTSLTWIFYILIPCLLTGGMSILPAPQNLSVQSVNMKHLLTWSPVTVPGHQVHYSVEYQGEYESLYRSHIWIPSSWCLATEAPECDVSDDITATVPYNLRVRATLGLQSSAWSTLQYPFNRNSTLLTPPGMALSKDGFHLVIELEDLGPQCEFLVAYWQKQPGAQEQVRVVRRGGIPVHLDIMEPGIAYCAKAQTVVKAIGRHSAFSQAQCVMVPGEAIPLVLALFAFIGFILILVAVPLSVWEVCRLLRYCCCPSVVLPDTLKITSSPQKFSSSCRKEEVAACAVATLPLEGALRGLGTGPAEAENLVPTSTRGKTVSGFLQE
ncbi:interleukin-20 receptor subunit beta [Sorex fumeus]|uniref:interleukin-20 receptor subunit beta n=1 Tax=Sorex fumeus TaxID=62283 RepID=UPI0024AE22E1|nr:interleukin-20 receptor subunit beta [Sorex fumeus]